MSSKRKADQVEGVGVTPNPSSSLSQEKQAKKHITLTHSPTPSTRLLPTPPSSSLPLPPPIPSSPRTAPLPTSPHTPPALPDGLLAALTLSPLSSQRRAGPLSVSVPSSPAKPRRNRLRATLPSVPPLATRAATDSSAPVGDGLPDNSSASATPAAVTPPASTGVPSAGPASQEAEVAVVRVEDGVKGEGVGVDVGRSSVSHALNVDSAIRGMQGISLSSLSSTAAPSSSNASPAEEPPTARPVASAVTATATPRILPLIRLTLNHSGVRRTNSSESAQGNLKKHKRSIASPSPINAHRSPEKDAPAPSARTSLSPPPHLRDGTGGDNSRLSFRPTSSPARREAEAGETTGTSPEIARGGAREERDEEEEESIGSLETALSASSLQVRSPSASTVGSSGSLSSAPIRCEVCNKELSSAAQLEDHQQGRRHQHVLLMRESGKAFTCELCQKVFTSAADQEKHAQGEKHRELMQALGIQAGDGLKGSALVLACELCGVTFTGLTQQRQHLEGKKHQSMVRDQERQGKEGKEDGGKERRKRDDSKGRDSIDADGLTSSKKRKYGRSSPAILQQQQMQHSTYHLQQQQPSPTPRRILPSGSVASPPALHPTPPGRIQQTIRYITPPPPVQVRRSSSRSVGSGSSDGGGMDGGQPVEGEGQGRRSGLYHPHPLRSVPGVHPHEDGEGSYASYPSSVGSYEESPAQYEAAYPPYPVEAQGGGEYPGLYQPQPPPSYMYPFPPMGAGYGPPLPPHMAFYPPPMGGMYLQSPMPAPMFAYLSPSAAAALSGPMVPSLTPITVMYPTELLLSHSFTMPPLYIVPGEPPVPAVGQPAPVDSNTGSESSRLVEGRAGEGEHHSAASMDPLGEVDRVKRVEDSLVASEVRDASQHVEAVPSAAF